MIRLHVSEIRSVTYWRSESGSEHYTINYRGGRLPVGTGMSDFVDFLGRLKSQNPAVDLSSFPALLAETWPELGGAEIEEHGSMSRFLRAAIFPLIVISALAWLAIQSIHGH